MQRIDDEALAALASAVNDDYHSDDENNRSAPAPTPLSNPPTGHKLFTHKYVSLDELEDDLHDDARVWVGAVDSRRPPPIGGRRSCQRRYYG